MKPIHLLSDSHADTIGLGIMLLAIVIAFLVWRALKQFNSVRWEMGSRFFWFALEAKNPIRRKPK